MIPTQAIYVIGVIFLGLFLFGFFWFILYAAITQIGTAVTTSMSQYSGSASYSTFEYASVFMVNLWKYLLAVGIIGLFLWAIIYSQRRGQVMIE